MKYKRVLLINPFAGGRVYGTKSKDIPPTSVPLGLAYVASFLEHKGFTVDLIDADSLGLEGRALAKRIRKFRPDLVGLTCTSPTFGSAVKAASTVKKMNPNMLVVIGGPHVSGNIEDTLGRDCFDVVVCGEGELQFYDLCKGKSFEKIDGIAYVKGEKIVTNPLRGRITDLDQLPFPAYHMLPLRSYHDPIWNIYGDFTISVITSRGCPFECTFCASKIVFGRRVVFRSIKRVLEEVKYLRDEFGADSINFVDDTLTLNKDRVTELCKGMKKLGMKWFCNARVDSLDFKTLKMMKDNGCCVIKLGIESGDEKILKSVKKRTNLRQIVNVSDWSHQVGLDTFSTFIIGLPEDTEKTIRKTIDLAKRINSTYSFFFILVPYPSTEIYEYAVEHDLLLFDDWVDVVSPKYENPTLKHKLFTSEELKRWQKRAYREVYLRPEYFFVNILPKLKSFRMIRYLFKQGISFLKGFVM